MKKYIILILIIGLGYNNYAQNLRNPIDQNDVANHGLVGISSDWGPRFFLNGTFFHGGLDYVKPPAPGDLGDPFYAIEGGILTFSKAPTESMSYIEVGNWVYRHVWIDNHVNKYWILNRTPDINNVRLETIDNEGNTRIFVASNDAAFLNKEVVSKWLISATTTQTAKIGDIVFRANDNHLHLETTLDGNWRNPLEFIGYSGSGSNNMDIKLQVKRNIGNDVAQAFSDNIIFGTKIIVESDIDYHNELDLDLTEVDVEPFEGNYANIASWKYSGVGHVTLDRGTGISSTSYYNVILETGSESTILYDIREGIFPVKTNYNNNLGRDILKRYWNSQLNWYTDNPDFPDGPCTLYLTTTDIRGNKKTISQTKVIDNFRPYIKKVEVRKGSKEGTVVYCGVWNWSSGSLNLTKTGSGCQTTDQLWVHVYPSEPMYDVSISVNDNNCYALNESTKDHYIFPVGSGILGNINSITIKNSCTDFAGNSLYGITQGTNQISIISFPIHRNDDTWYNASSVDDNAHQFGALFPGQYFCHIPPEKPTVITNTSKQVIVSWVPFGDGTVYRVYRSSLPLMIPKTEISNGWTSQNTITDQPGAGVWYYAVEAAIYSENKSSQEDNCELSPSERILIEDANDPYAYLDAELKWFPSFDDCTFDLYLAISNLVDGATYDVTIDFGDGHSETIIGYQNMELISHRYEPGLDKTIYYPKAMVYLRIDGGIKDYTIYGDKITVSALPRELRLSVHANNDKAVSRGVPISIVATASDYNYNHDGELTWFWCITNTPNDIESCTCYSNGDCIDWTTTTTGNSSITHTFDQKGLYLVTVYALDQVNRISPRVDYYINVGDPSNPKVRVNGQIYGHDDYQGRVGCPIKMVLQVTGFNTKQFNTGAISYHLYKIEFLINDRLDGFYLFDENKYEVVYPDDLNLKYEYGQQNYIHYYTPTQSGIIEAKIMVTLRGYDDNTNKWTSYTEANHYEVSINITDCDSNWYIHNQSSLKELVAKCHNENQTIKGGIFNLGNLASPVILKKEMGNFFFPLDGVLKISAANLVYLLAGFKTESGAFLKVSTHTCIDCPTSLPNKSLEDHSLTSKDQLVTNHDPILKIYPNPTTSSLTVQLINPGKTEGFNLKIYSVDGKITDDLDIEKNQTTINVSKFTKGVYLLVAKTQDLVLRQDFIKE